MASTCVVLGGGLGGVVAANELRKRLSDDHRVILVDKRARHEFAPSYTWLMLGWRNESQVTRDLARLRHRNIECLTAPVTRINTGDRKVEAGGGELAYDHLVVSLGAELAVDAIPGLMDAHTFHSLEGAKRLAPALGEFSSGRIILAVGGLPYKCPASPYEGVLLIDDFLRRRGLAGKFSIEVYTPEKLPLPSAGPAVGAEVAELLASRDIKFNAQMTITAVDARAGKAFFGDNVSVDYDLLIAVPPHRAPAAVRDSGLVSEAGWIPVDGETLATSARDVYAIGDITSIKLPNGMMLPKAGVFAERQAKVVARNIAARIRGQGPSGLFAGDGACFMDSGRGQAAMAQGNFYAEPDPDVKLLPPSHLRHWTKVAFEKYWLWRWF